MADILYTYKNGVYVNLTNRCSCSCTFCVRNQQESVNGEESMWHEREPSLREVKKAMDAFDFAGFDELIYCGYGEPTCALEVLVESAKYFRKKHNQKIRINTNGIGRLYHGYDILPELNEVADAYSVSLNAPEEKRYNELARPAFPGAFQSMLSFAKDAKKAGKEVQFSVVTIISEEEIHRCQKLADELEIPLKVRRYEKK